MRNYRMNNLPPPPPEGKDVDAASIRERLRIAHAAAYSAEDRAIQDRVTRAAAQFTAFGSALALKERKTVMFALIEAERALGELDALVDIRVGVSVLGAETGVDVALVVVLLDHALRATRARLAEITL